MANDIDKTSPHYKGEFGSIYEVNQKFPNGGVAGDYVEIDGWAHYWNANRGTWCVNAQRDSYWDELITGIIEKFKLFKGATYMGVAGLDTEPAKAIGAKMYYFATVAGTYKNFEGLVVPQGINVLYSENGSSWVCSTLLEVAQELGVSTRNVVSQKVVKNALDLKANQSSVNEALAKKADKETVNSALGKKFDKESVAQESGDSEKLVMSQKAVSDKLSDLTKDTNIYNISNRTKKKYTIDGTRQVERLYINTYPANDGNITLTLNGDSKTIFVSGGENTEENRKALAASIAALNFKNWFAEHDNTGVLFTYNDIGATLSRSVINSENTGANIKIGIIIASSVSVLEDIPTEFKNGGLTISFVNAITNCISIYRLRTEFWTNDFNAWEDVTNYDVVFPAYKKIIEPNLRYYLDSANSLAKSISFDNNNIINVVGGENTATLKFPIPKMASKVYLELYGTTEATIKDNAFISIIQKDDFGSTYGKTVLKCSQFSKTTIDINERATNLLIQVYNNKYAQNSSSSAILRRVVFICDNEEGSTKLYSNFSGGLMEVTYNNNKLSLKVISTLLLADKTINKGTYSCSLNNSSTIYFNYDTQSITTDKNENALFDVEMLNGGVSVDNLNGICLAVVKNGDTLNPIAGNYSGSYIDISKILPANTKYDVSSIIDAYKNKGVYLFVFGNGTYYTTKNLFGYNDKKLVSYIGSGAENTIVRMVDKGFTDVMSLAAYTYSYCNFKDITIVNMSCYSNIRINAENTIFNYTLTIDGANGNFKMIGTFVPSYDNSQALSLKNVQFKSTVQQYRGINCMYMKDVVLDNVYIENCSYPIVFYGGENILITNCHIKKGTVGIAFLGSNMLFGTTRYCKIKNNLIEDVKEESITADIIGNKSPASKIAELAFISSENITLDNSMVAKKMYVKAQKCTITDSGLEYSEFNAFDSESVKHSVLQFDNDKVYGGSETGKFYTIIDAGIEGEKGYVVFYNGDKELDLPLDQFKTCSIVNGFYNNIIANNVIKNGVTPICLWFACGGNIIAENIADNCTGKLSLEYGPAAGTRYMSNYNIIKGNVMDILSACSTYGNPLDSIGNIFTENISKKIDIKRAKDIIVKNNIGQISLANVTLHEDDFKVSDS